MSILAAPGAGLNTVVQLLLNCVIQKVVWCNARYFGNCCVSVKFCICNKGLGVTVFADINLTAGP